MSIHPNELAMAFVLLTRWFSTWVIHSWSELSRYSLSTNEIIFSPCLSKSSTCSMFRMFPSAFQHFLGSVPSDADAACRERKMTSTSLVASDRFTKEGILGLPDMGVETMARSSSVQVVQDAKCHIALQIWHCNACVIIRSSHYSSVLVLSGDIRPAGRQAGSGCKHNSCDLRLHSSTHWRSPSKSVVKRMLPASQELASGQMRESRGRNTSWRSNTTACSHSQLIWHPCSKPHHHWIEGQCV